MATWNINGLLFNSTVCCYCYSTVTSSLKSFFTCRAARTLVVTRMVRTRKLPLYLLSGISNTWDQSILGYKYGYCTYLHAIRKIRYCTDLRVHTRASGKKIELTINQISRFCGIFIRFIRYFTCSKRPDLSFWSLCKQRIAIISAHVDRSFWEPSSVWSACKQVWKLRICQALHTKLASQQPIVKGILPLLAKLFDSVSTGGG